MRYFMSYATANESNYFADFRNFYRLSRRDPGVPLVEMHIAVSEVKPATGTDRMMLRRLVALVERNPKVKVCATTFKSNVGRDFSSAATNLRAIAREAGDDDFVLCTNRSAEGPFEDGWYRAFVDLKARTRATMVGASVGFKGHPLGPRRQFDSTAVQTYAYGSDVGFFRSMLDAFPAATETDRVQLIVDGEVGLSERIVARGGTLAVLTMPTSVISRRVNDPDSFPHQDKRRGPFVHRRKIPRKRLRAATWLPAYWLWRSKPTRAARFEAGPAGSSQPR